MKSLKNNRGNFYALMTGMLLVIGGIFAYIIINPVFEGIGPNGVGIFDIAEKDATEGGLGINGSAGTTLGMMKATWTVLPWCFIIAGILTIVFSIDDRREFDDRRF